MFRLLLATTNTHKTAEVAAMLGPEWQVEDLRAHPEIVPAEETGTTFEANAILKAQGASQALPGLWVLADDSGLEVDMLDGAPGVWSARYAGPDATDADNRVKLKTALRAVAKNPGQHFKGRFHCCMALVRDAEVLTLAHGTVEGHLLLREQGAGGFGYDSLFVPEGHHDSFGVLSPEVKNGLSHRAAALLKIRAWLAANVKAG
jgi:XTP/dITP diphosphohydrolase